MTDNPSLIVHLHFHGPFSAAVSGCLLVSGPGSAPPHVGQRTVTGSYLISWIVTRLLLAAVTGSAKVASLLVSKRALQLLAAAEKC